MVGDMRKLLLTLSILIICSGCGGSEVEEHEPHPVSTTTTTEYIPVTTTTRYIYSPPTTRASIIFGRCGDRAYTCDRGRYQYVPDTTYEYRWNCLGSGEYYVDAGCTKDKVSPTTTSTTRRSLTTTTTRFIAISARCNTGPSSRTRRCSVGTIAPYDRSCGYRKYKCLSPNSRAHVCCHQY